MTNEQIEKMLDKKTTKEDVFLIRFKTRNSIKGLFIQTADYAELSRKNLWRIVSESKVEEFNKTGNENLARIFNGTEFTRLELQS